VHTFEGMTTSLPTIDREKVLNVLLKRFPEARLCDIAAAANAIVGLGPEFRLLPAAQLERLEIDLGERQYTRHHVENDEVRVYCRINRM
jgi:hypothetical protein